jgi:hypothetical protein
MGTKAMHRSGEGCKLEAKGRGADFGTNARIKEIEWRFRIQRNP